MFRCASPAARRLVSRCGIGFPAIGSTTVVAFRCSPAAAASAAARAAAAAPPHHRAFAAAGKGGGSGKKPDPKAPASPSDAQQQVPKSAASGSSGSSRANANAPGSMSAAEWEEHKAELKTSLDEAPFLSDDERAQYLAQLPTLTQEQFSELHVEQVTLVSDAELAKLKKPSAIPMPVFTEDDELAAIAWQYASRFGPKIIDKVHQDLQEIVKGIREPSEPAPAAAVEQLRKSLTAEVQALKKDPKASPELVSGLEGWIKDISGKADTVPVALRPAPQIHPGKQLERLSSYESQDVVMDLVDPVLKPLKLDPATVLFVKLLVRLKKFRMPVFEEMVERFHTLTLHDRKQVPTTITSAAPLDTEAKKLIQAAIDDLIQEGWSAVVTEKVDPAIVGGVVVSAGSRAFDLSARRRIPEIRDSLANHARELA